MKIARPDLVSMVLTALAVVAIVVLSLSRLPVPDVLTYVAIGALGIGGGTALNTSGSATVDTAAQRITDALSSLQALIGDLRAGKLSAAAGDVAAAAGDVAAALPAPAPAPAPAVPAPVIPAPAVPINQYPSGVTR